MAGKQPQIRQLWKQSRGTDNSVNKQAQEWCPLEDATAELIMCNVQNLSFHIFPFNMLQSSVQASSSWRFHRVRLSLTPLWLDSYTTAVDSAIPSSLSLCLILPQPIPPALCANLLAPGDAVDPLVAYCCYLLVVTVPGYNHCKALCTAKKSPKERNALFLPISPPSCPHSAPFCHISSCSTSPKTGLPICG